MLRIPMEWNKTVRDEMRVERSIASVCILSRKVPLVTEGSSIVGGNSVAGEIGTSFASDCWIRKASSKAISTTTAKEWQ